jgi:hypothetical protein
MARESLNLFNVPMSVQQAQEMERQAYLDRIAKGGEEASFAQSERLMQNIKSKLFGIESPEIQRARQMEQAMAGINYNDPASLEAARAAVSAISPESGMAFDQYLLNRMATQRDIQAKDLEMAIQAQEAITAANAVPEGSQWKVTDTAANSLAKNLVDRGMITEEQAPMIAAQIQHQSSVYGGDVPTILKRLGLGGQPQQDQYGSVNSGRNVDTSVQP